MTKQEVLAKLKFDMEVRNRAQSTIEDYLLKVSKYQDYHDESADNLQISDVEKYLHYLLTEKKLKPSSVNTHNSALRFLYEVTLDVTLNFKKIPRVKAYRTLPELPTKKELIKLFNCAPGLMYKAIFITIYGSGLRVSEAANLKITDIDSENMRIFIRKGKGGRDRYALLPQKTLEILREYYKCYKPKEWLFITRNKTQMTPQSIGNAFRTALSNSKINKHPTVHTLRHCFATHLLNDGKNLFEIKKLLGHVRIDTTTWYLQLSDSKALKLNSPLNSMDLKTHE